ncbi:hypothetical protein [Micromonospora aurantiaca (nom. illeg.)]|uniref:hypothetical protein n=1 Tax=Micromonospora aurantiaca (nom. illeg.) TaxID=47850 RepID=UPI0036644764
MNDKDVSPTDSDMTDAEFDSWLQDVNDGICDSLDDVVDTETDLLRLKQNVAQRAVAVAHASGCDGPDRAIRSVFVDASQSPASLEMGGAQRTALGPGPRALAYHDAQRQSALRHHGRRLHRVLVPHFVTLLVTLAAVGLSIATFVAAATGGDEASAAPPVWLAGLVTLTSGSWLLKCALEVLASRKEVISNALIQQSDVLHGQQTVIWNWRDEGRRAGTKNAATNEDGDHARSVKFVRLLYHNLSVLHCGTLLPPQERQYLVTLSNLCKAGTDDTGVRSPMLVDEMKQQLEPVADAETDLERSGIEDSEDGREPPTVGGGAGLVAVRSSQRPKRLASSNQRRSLQRPPSSPGVTRRLKG